MLPTTELQNLLILDEAEENSLRNSRVSVLTAECGAVLQGIAAELLLSPGVFADTCVQAAVYCSSHNLYLRFTVRIHTKAVSKFTGSTGLGI
jgi:hypothetical protein